MCGRTAPVPPPCCCNRVLCLPCARCCPRRLGVPPIPHFQVSSALRTSPQLCASVNAVFQFVITGTGSYYVDLKHPPGRVHKVGLWAWLALLCPHTRPNRLRLLLRCVYRARRLARM